MNLQQQHYLANMNSGSKIIAALTDENPSSAKEVVESTLLRKAGECIKENVGPAVDKSPINEGYHEESYHEGLQAGYLYASHCYKEAMGRREGMRRLNANVMEPMPFDGGAPSGDMPDDTWQLGDDPRDHPDYDPDNSLDVKKYQDWKRKNTPAKKALNAAHHLMRGMNERSYTWGTRPAFGGRRRKVRVKDGDPIPPGFRPSKPDGPLTPGGRGYGNHGPFGPSI